MRPDGSFEISVLVIEQPHAVLNLRGKEFGANIPMGKVSQPKNMSIVFCKISEKAQKFLITRIMKQHQPEFFP
jgi:hypothetical protein